MSYSSGSQLLYRTLWILYSRGVKSPRPLADPRLTALLQALLSEELLPPLDRWFSRFSKERRWSVAEQKHLWDLLRVALTRGWSMVDDPSTPAATAWPGFRGAVRGRAMEWATRAVLSPNQLRDLGSSGVPLWLKPSWDERCRRSGWSDGDRQRFLGQQERPTPVHVRFRPGPEGEACQQRMRASGACEPSDVGIDRLTGVAGLQAAPEWKQGLVEIQDAASQLSLVRLGLRPGQRVWDLCAGQGGKTLLAATELRGKGTLVATDVAEGKLRVLKERVRRSGWQNIRISPWDGKARPDWGPEFRGGQGFDRVIVDAPCSASGTWRRDPDGRFRLVPRVLQELAGHQARLIRLGWDALKPGGRLAYITCSWLPEENEAVVEEFVGETGAVVVHQELLGLPAFDANTLFVAILEKGR